MYLEVKSTSRTSKFAALRRETLAVTSVSLSTITVRPLGPAAMLTLDSNATSVWRKTGGQTEEQSDKHANRQTEILFESYELSTGKTVLLTKHFLNMSLQLFFRKKP